MTKKINPLQGSIQRELKDSHEDSEGAEGMQEAATDDDMRAFRMATLRATLMRMGMAFERNADEETLKRLLRIAERRNADRLRRQKAWKHREANTGNSDGAGGKVGEGDHDQ